MLKAAWLPRCCSSDSMLPPTQCLQEEMLTYKISNPATSISAKWRHETLAYKWYITVTGIPAPLNPIEGSRLTLTYSTMLNSTWGPYRKQTSTKRNALRQRPRFRVLSLARCDASARPLSVAKRSDWMSITEYCKYPSPKCGWERRATNNTQGLPRVT